MHKGNSAGAIKVVRQMTVVEQDRTTAPFTSQLRNVGGGGGKHIIFVGDEGGDFFILP